MSKRRPISLTMSEARASFAKVLSRAEQGEAVQVTRGGRPVAVILSVEQFREGQRQSTSASESFRSFMQAVDRRALRGADPWAGVRDRSTGREFRW